jgi:polysaccharide biosynthesis/export protein
MIVDRADTIAQRWRVRVTPWIRIGRVAAALAVLLAVAGCDARPDASPAGAPPQVADYIIGPGDTLSIFVYQSPALSVNELPVRPDGRISVPLVPDIQAAGKTPSALGTEIGEKLRAYVKDPVVTVMVRSFVGPLDRQIRVIGEATEPRAIPYRASMSVLDVMIAARGLTRYAAGNRAVIVRRLPDGGTRTLHVRLADLLRDGDISANLAMAPGDTLIIPQSFF